MDRNSASFNSSGKEELFKASLKQSVNLSTYSLTASFKILTGSGPLTFLSFFNPKDN